MAHGDGGTTTSYLLPPGPLAFLASVALAQVNSTLTVSSDARRLLISKVLASKRELCRGDPQGLVIIIG